MAYNDADDYRDDLNDWQDEEEQDLDSQDDYDDDWIDDLDNDDEDEDEYDFDPADEDEDDDWDDDEDDTDDYDDEPDDVADDEDDEGDGFDDWDDDLDGDDLDDEDDDLDDFDDYDDEDDYDDFDDEDDEDEDGTGYDAEVKRLRRENAHRRIQNRELQETAAAAVEQGIADFGKTLADQLGLDLDDYTADNMAAAVRAQLQDQQTKTNKVTRDLAIYRAAGPAGADFDKLADSKTFTSAVDELDPTADDYADQVGQLVHKALESNPEWKKPAQVKRSGGDFTNTAPTTEGDSIEALQKRRRNRRKNQ